jgi:hypothetical protein
MITNRVFNESDQIQNNRRGTKSIKVWACKLMIDWVSVISKMVLKNPVPKLNYLHCFNKIFMRKYIYKLKKNY